MKNINFQLQQGDALGIIGRNGAGKSTLLKILSRVTAPTDGNVKVKGRIASLLEVGTGFHHDLTGRENIYMNGAIMGMRKAEITRKLDEIVDFSGVEKFIDTPVKRYSSGMFVRLAFAVAAHLEPDILIVDEVLAVGDIEFQKKCLGKMGEASHEGRTVLFVSHNTASVRNLCTTCLLLNKGEVTMIGPVDEVINRYIHSEITKFPADIKLPRIKEKLPGAGKSLHVLSQAGDPKTVFRLREPWKVKFEFEMFEFTRQVSAGFHLVNAKSVTVITYISAPKDLEPGRYQVEFLIDLPLSSSDLHFNLVIWSFDRPIYTQSNIDGVSIVDVAVENQPRLSTTAHGFIIAKQDEVVTRVKET